MGVDLETVRFTVVRGLPLRARWLVEDAPLDYDFSFAHRAEWQDNEWPGFWAFGAYDYDQSGGATPWLGVRQADGAVCGMNVHTGGRLFVLNSSIHRFIQTFDFLENCLLRGDLCPHHACARLRQIDPVLHPVSDWKALLDHLLLMNYLKRDEFASTKSKNESALQKKLSSTK